MPQPTLHPTLLWAVRLIPALIMLQTLYFKFTAQPESVALFEVLGVEPWGRWAAGIIELIASALLLMPSRYIVWGAALGTLAMTGAMTSHIMWLGISVQDDGGQLFGLAMITGICCAIALWQYWYQFPARLWMV